MENTVEVMAARQLMHRLGITANYTGYFHTSHAVMLSAQEPERLLLITKWIYPDVARHYHTTWRSVERNIRTVIKLAWETNRPELERMAQHALPNRPSAGTFLAILAAQAEKEYAKRMNKVYTNIPSISYETEYCVFGLRLFITQ